MQNIEQLAAEATNRAMAAGALLTIKTERILETGSLKHFLIRRKVNKREKPENCSGFAKRDSDRENPFLPYDPQLFVADSGKDHVYLLNKYNVCPNHLLIVTREFRRQDAPLDREDLVRLTACMEGWPALGFYNSSPTAGASQPHRHLQVVPLPMAEDLSPLPISAFAGSREDAGDNLFRFSGLPWEHLCAPRGNSGIDSATAYTVFCKRLGLFHPDGTPRLAYNLLMTDQWLMAVPRSRDRVSGISINALGYAGSFFVCGEEKLEALRRNGGIPLLLAAGFPR